MSILVNCQIVCTNLIPQSKAKGSSSRAGSGKETPDRWQRIVGGFMWFQPIPETLWNWIRVVRWDHHHHHHHHHRCMQDDNCAKRPPVVFGKSKWGFDLRLCKAQTMACKQPAASLACVSVVLPSLPGSSPSWSFKMNKISRHAFISICQSFAHHKQPVGGKTAPAFWAVLKVSLSPSRNYWSTSQKLLNFPQENQMYFSLCPVIYREFSPENSREFFLLSHRHALLQRATGLLEKVFFGL